MKRYKSAPITEAVIEIRVQPPAQDDPAVLQQLAESLKAEFPKQAPMQFLEMGIAQQPGQMFQQKISQSIVGVRLSKTDDSRVLQIRHEGFAYSHMAPIYRLGDLQSRSSAAVETLSRSLCQGEVDPLCASLYQPNRHSRGQD